MSDISTVIKACEAIEAQLTKFAEKTDAELKATGSQSADTKAAIEGLEIKQREIADRLLQIEQSGTAQKESEVKSESWGEQFVKSARYADFAGGQMAKLRVEVKNTLTGSDTNVAPNRLAGVVGGAFLPFSMENLLPSTTTTSNAIEFTKEASFTNSAAEAAEGTQKGESSLKWALVTMPVSTVAHMVQKPRDIPAGEIALQGP